MRQSTQCCGHVLQLNLMNQSLLGKYEFSQRLNEMLPAAPQT